MNTSTTHREAEMEHSDQYNEELGTLVFQSALMRYLSVEDSDSVAIFEGYIDRHVAEENFLGDLCATYPAFEKMLVEEMEILQSELQSVTTSA